ncbi:IS701 family transposase [Pseudobacteriovorax antillogorgiicola]|nr:transposase [Pseudobacteriovorax antillogorgiicola]
MSVPSFISDFMSIFSECASKPSMTRLCELLTARILAIGKSTISNLARVYGLDPYACPWHHVFSRYSISLWPFSLTLIRLIISTFSISRNVILAIDDTTCLHKGPKVFGRAKHRDGVRSSHGTLVPLMGHKWVVLSIVVRIPGTFRQWALPIAVGLCRSSEFAKSQKKRHKTPAHIGRLLVAKIKRSFPKINFIIVGDQGFGQHQSAKDFSKPGLTLVSKFYPDAVLRGLPQPKKKGQPGRQQTMGARLPKPSEVVNLTENFSKATVSWYGGGERDVEFIANEGFWYRQGKGVVKVKWVFVRDITGTHRDEYLYTTDTNLSPEEVISLFTSRWAIETTFQECKGQLKIESTRVWSERSTLSLIPLIFGMYSMVVLITKDKVTNSTRFPISWPGKKGPTFSDMILILRRNTWEAYLNINTQMDQGTYAIRSSEIRKIIGALCQSG